MTLLCKIWATRSQIHNSRLCIMQSACLCFPQWEDIWQQLIIKQITETVKSHKSLKSLCSRKETHSLVIWIRSRMPGWIIGRARQFWCRLEIKTRRKWLRKSSTWQMPDNATRPRQFLTPTSPSSTSLWPRVKSGKKSRLAGPTRLTLPELLV